MSTSMFTFEGQSVRVTMIDDEPWWYAADTCSALGIVNSRHAISALDEDERDVVTDDTPSGLQKLNIISEPGLYSLIMRSRRPEAKRFKRWVTHEVLPQIRKTGSYAMHSANLVQTWGLPADYDEALEAHLLGRREIARLNAVVAETERPAAFAQQFMSAGGSMSMSDVAKALHGFDTPIIISPLKIWHYLETQKWVFRHPKDNKWRAMQPLLDKQFLIHRVGSEYKDSRGIRQIGAPQVRMTAKGFYALVDLLNPPKVKPLGPGDPLTPIGILDWKRGLDD